MRGQYRSPSISAVIASEVACIEACGQLARQPAVSSSQELAARNGGNAIDAALNASNIKALFPRQVATQSAIEKPQMIAITMAAVATNSEFTSSHQLIVGNWL